MQYKVKRGTEEVSTLYHISAKTRLILLWFSEDVYGISWTESRPRIDVKVYAWWCITLKLIFCRISSFCRWTKNLREGKMYKNCENFQGWLCCHSFGILTYIAKRWPSWHMILLEQKINQYFIYFIYLIYLIGWIHVLHSPVCVFF